MIRLPLELQGEDAKRHLIDFLKRGKSDEFVTFCRERTDISIDTGFRLFEQCQDALNAPKKPVDNNLTTAWGWTKLMRRFLARTAK